jgi:enamine deaminase RidA (YjgF/YER057c/UK114 family)
MIERVASGSPWAEPIGFSAAVRAGDWVHTAGMTAVGADREVVGGDDAAAQAREALRKVLAALAQAGAAPDQVVRTRMYVTDPADVDAVGRAHGEVFGTVRPAATLVVVAALADPRMRVEIEAVAYIGRA